MSKFDSYFDPPEPHEDPSIAIMEAIGEEVSRQHKAAFNGNTANHDQTNSENDFIAIVLAYLGRASRKVFRNDREACGYRENMIKAAATIVSALCAESFRDSAESDPGDHY